MLTHKMTDMEFDGFLLELRGLLLKYSFEFTDGRKARVISIISLPPKKRSNHIE